MLNARPGKSATDEHAMGWDSHELTPVDSTSVKITVDSVYSTQNNGFIEIEVHAGKHVKSSVGKTKSV